MFNSRPLTTLFVFLVAFAGLMLRMGIAYLIRSEEGGFKEGDFKKMLLWSLAISFLFAIFFFFILWDG